MQDKRTFSGPAALVMGRTMQASGKARHDKELLKRGEKLEADAKTAMESGKNSVDRPSEQKPGEPSKAP